MHIALRNIEAALLIFSGLHDPDTEQHLIRVKNLCMKMAAHLQLSASQTEELRLAAILHDIGKGGIYRQVLNKAGGFTDGEWAMVRMHTLFGFELSDSLGLPATVCNAIRGHHENYDGRGYPDQLKGESIPQAARIIRLADTFDALTTSRPDREAVTQRAALEVIKKDAHIFDPHLLETFLQMMSLEDDGR